MATAERAPILLLGGTGKVASRISKRLQAKGIPVIIACRSGITPDDCPHGSGVPFNWLDKATYENPFVHPWAMRCGGIREIFIVAPPVVDVAPIVKPFIDMAVEKGARRLVLLSASPLEEGGQAMGQVHAYLREVGETKGIEWAVLRPSWFMGGLCFRLQTPEARLTWMPENFSSYLPHVLSIKEEGRIYSATEDGRIPFVSADDIAACAVSALTTLDAPNVDYLVLGDELLSYGDVSLSLASRVEKLHLLTMCAGRWNP